MTASVFAWIVCACGLLAPSSSTLYLFVLFSLFGAAAALTLPALGGATITPAVLYLPFLIVRAVVDREPSRSRFGHLSGAGIWLSLLVGWGILSAYFLPRIFEGETQVFVRDRLASTGVGLYQLRPMNSNLTQSVYALGQLLAFFAMRSLLVKPGRMAVFRDAVLVVTALNCLGALINLAEFHLGLPSLLQYLRTAEGYSLANDYAVGGLLRIHGTFSEASAFAYFTLPMLAFCFSLWMSGVRRAYTGSLALGSAVLLLLSTSATGAGGLALYLLLRGVGFLMATSRRKPIPHTATLVLLAATSIAVVLALFTFELRAADRIASFVDAELLNKLQTDSGLERTSWNSQAWLNFLDTYGIGAGLGSARASGYPLVILSNLGVLGALLFFMFVVKVVRMPRLETPLASTGDASAAVTLAARHAVLANAIGASLCVGMFDLGPSFYAFAAAATVWDEYDSARARLAVRR